MIVSKKASKTIDRLEGRALRTGEDWRPAGQSGGRAGVGKSLCSHHSEGWFKQEPSMDIKSKGEEFY